MRWIKNSDNPIKKIVLQPITSWLSMGSMITMIPDNQKIYAEWHSYEKNSYYTFNRGNWDKSLPFFVK